MRYGYILNVSIISSERKVAMVAGAPILFLKPLAF